MNLNRIMASLFAALLINTAAVGTSFATSLASLKGTWVITLGGVTGGALDTAYYVTATLDKNGSDGTPVTNADVTATSAAGITETNEVFYITKTSWDAKKRTADATLSCQSNTSCGFSSIKIQVSKDGQMFNAFFTSGDGLQRLVGTGVKQ